MILTCPECASRYFVDDALVGPEGREVRCSNCGRRWRAGGPAATGPAPPPPDDLVAEPRETPAKSDGPIAASLTPPRPKPARGGKPAKSLVNGLAWAAVAAVLAALLAVAVVFRAQVVRLAPRTASAYAAVGLPVNSVGLVIEGLRAEPAMRDGHAALTVTGVLRNIEDHEVQAPPLRVSLLNPAGRRVAGKLAAAVDPRIPAGETRRFAIELLDPPSTAKDLEITFMVAGAPTAKAGVPAAGH